MFDAAIDGTFKAHLRARARTSPSPTPTRSMSKRRCSAMECVMVQDLFLNETAKFAHVFLPGAIFLEKNGTFTNAERRISPRAQGDEARSPATRTGKSRRLLSKALGYPMHYNASRPRSWTRSHA
jgi:formate dehydrogenase major subunit